MPETPYYFIQIPHTGADKLGRILRIPPSQVTVRDALKRYGPEWKNMFSFAMVRNPYARAASLYGAYYYTNKHNVLEHNISFLNFLNLTLKHQQKPFFDKPRVFQSQWDWLRNFKDELGVIALAEYEQYYTSVFTLLQMVGIDSEGLNIRPMSEPNPYKWQRYYEGADGRLAKSVVREFWQEDFIKLGCYDE